MGKKSLYRNKLSLDRFWTGRGGWRQVCIWKISEPLSVLRRLLSPLFLYMLSDRSHLPGMLLLICGPAGSASQTHASAPLRPLPKLKRETGGEREREMEAADCISPRCSRRFFGSPCLLCFSPIEALRVAALSNRQHPVWLSPHQMCAE